MTAEEYIEANIKVWCKNKEEWEKDILDILPSGDYVSKNNMVHSNRSHIGYISYDNVKNAIEMARKEERERAVRALDIIAIMAIFERNTHSVSMGELRDQLNKLLNE